MAPPSAPTPAGRGSANKSTNSASSSSSSLAWEEADDASTAGAYMQDTAEFERHSRLIFDRLDANQSGGLDRQELAAAMKRTGLPASAFHLYTSLPPSRSPPRSPAPRA